MSTLCTRVLHTCTGTYSSWYCNSMLPVPVHAKSNTGTGISNSNTGTYSSRYGIAISHNIAIQHTTYSSTGTGTRVRTQVAINIDTPFDAVCRVFHGIAMPTPNQGPHAGIHRLATILQ